MFIHVLLNDYNIKRISKTHFIPNYNERIIIHVLVKRLTFKYQIGRI